MSQVSNKNYPRRVVVDDTDQRLQYSGAWSLDTGSFDERGSYGAPYRRTMHGTNETGASFSFDFEGDYILVRGARDVRNSGKAPTWTCQVDGGIIPVFSYGNPAQVTHQVLCEQRRLSRRSHTLTVNVTIDNPADQTFWVDYVEFSHVPEANIDGETIRIDSSDWSSITYSNTTGQWEELLGGFNGTDQLGGTLSFRFNGTSASLYTFNEGSDEDWVATSGRYYIDNSGDTSFTIPGSKRLSNGSRSDFNNQLLFATPSLSPGEHELVITFEGQKTGTRPIQWLIVDYFHVTAASASKSQFPVAAVAGGVAGGVVLIAGIALAVFFYLKRKRDKERMNGMWEGTGAAFSLHHQHDTSVITPFLSDNSPAPTSTPYSGYPSYSQNTWSGPVGSSSTRNTTATMPLLAGEFGDASGNTSGRPSYPPEKRRIDPRTSFDGTERQTVRSYPSHTVLSPSSPPVSSPPASSSSASYFDPYAEHSYSYSNSTSNWESMKSAQRQAMANEQSRVIRHHEDSGVRLPHTVDLPPDYTRD
ncbi:hypothetical protein VNI00_000416 [Paramarasmius palmivorus]|uniref:Transmembrane protein n=1 Tax=Paramarasmius palmivorus TaxID=297713 RepID=A0AAW0EH02_9AGAR